MGFCGNLVRSGEEVDLRRAEEPAKLERAEDIGDQIGPDLPGLFDDDAGAARVLVPVPAAGQVPRGREDHARAAAEVDPFEAGRLAERRAVSPLVRQVAQLVVGREYRLLVQKLPVLFCMDRAGLSGDDGPTHHGLFDIAYCVAIRRWF